MGWQRTLSREELNSYPAQTTLRDLIVESEKSAQEKHCVVCQVEVNGLKLSETDEQRLGTSTVSEIEQFIAYGRSAQDLPEDTVFSIKTYLPILEQKASNIASNLRTQGFGPGFPLAFAELIDGFQLLDTYLQRSGLDQTWDRFGFKSTLKELLLSFTGRDSVRLADLIEYELTSCLRNWHDQISGK